MTSEQQKNAPPKRCKLKRIKDATNRALLPPGQTERGRTMTADLDTFEAACCAADATLAAADNRSSEPEIERLAKLPRFEYERQREDTARFLGVRVTALDKIVREQRTVAEDDAATLPHWKVEPSPKPVDGAALLDHL